MSGARDLITNGKRLFGVDNGSIYSQQITGSGCIATAIIGAFAAGKENCFGRIDNILVEKDAMVAAVGGYALVGVASELAAKKPIVEGPGSFLVAFLDTLKKLTFKEFNENMKIVQLK
jgi:hydroxyethylthiazole kinase-like sugar kinase family protein